MIQLWNMIQIQVTVFAIICVSKTKCRNKSITLPKMTDNSRQHPLQSACSLKTLISTVRLNIILIYAMVMFDTVMKLDADTGNTAQRYLY